MCTTASTIKEWKHWCRLCAKHDGHYFDFFKEHSPEDSNMNLHSAIEEYFHINIKPNDELPHFLCTECCSTIISLEKYAELVKKVQIMYEDLRNATAIDEIDLKELHDKYGIVKCEPFKPQIMSMIDTPTTTSNVEQIFVADVPGTVVKTEEKGRTKTQVLEQEMEIKVELIDPFANDNENLEEFTQMTEDSDSSGSSICPSDNEDFVKQTKLRQRRSSNTMKNYAKTDSFVDKNSKEGRYICNICKQRFMQSRNYGWHMRHKHGTENPLWNCPHCTESLKYKKELDRHIKKIHAPSVYPCPHCERKFKGAKVAANHIKAEHEGAGSFVCEECGERVRTNDKLIEHMATHTGHGAYECKDCGKHFARKMSLKRHLEIHGDKHICGVCGLELNTSLALKSHMKVHSNEMPYKCNYCGRRFKRTKNLKNHLITHTGLKPYSCDFCDKTFSTGSSCRYHKKHLHPKELAALEAAGVKSYTKNIPKLHFLKAITQAPGDVEKDEVNVSDKRMKLPKLDAELPDV